MILSFTHTHTVMYEIAYDTLDFAFTRISPTFSLVAFLLAVVLWTFFNPYTAKLGSKSATKIKHKKQSVKITN